ncbi:MAG: IS3 family transposase [Oligoflexales bacterium]|nr:IS3 family transposase [Oligoflexales bacterium]
MLGRPEMKYAFIKDHRDKFEVALMCNVLAVSRSGFYDWLTRDNSTKNIRLELIKLEIRSIFKKSRKTYGVPRMLKALLAKGYKIGKEKVAELMRIIGLKPKASKRFKALTTQSKHKYPVVSNKLNQDFSCITPNKKWVGDVTFIDTDEGWLYLAAVLDLCTRKIVGWAMYEANDRHLTISALTMALKRQKVASNLLFHSDRGSNYACFDFQDMLTDLGLEASMSRSGCCYDNAVMESFFHTLKTEFVHHENFATKQQAKDAIFEWIEVFYNRERIHSSIGYKTPVAFEEEFMLIA